MSEESIDGFWTREQALEYFERFRELGFTHPIEALRYIAKNAQKPEAERDPDRDFLMFVANYTLTLAIETGWVTEAFLDAMDKSLVRHGIDDSQDDWFLQWCEANASNILRQINHQVDARFN